MDEGFYLRQNPYNLRKFIVFATDNPRNKYLLSSSVCRANQLWQTLTPKLSSVQHCSSLKIKSKLGTGIDVNIKFTRDVLLLLLYQIISAIKSLSKSYKL